MDAQSRIRGYEAQIFILNREIKSKHYSKSMIRDFTYTRDQLVKLMNELKDDLANDTDT